MRTLVFFLLLGALVSCSADLSEEDELIEDQRIKISQLEQEIEKVDEFLEVFSGKYDDILLSLDSIGLIKDSLEIISRQGSTYGDDRITNLQARLVSGQAAIDELKRRLADNDDGNSTIAFLRSELDRAQKRITGLEENRRTLTAENDSIRNILTSTTTSLAIARADARESEQSLSDTRVNLRKAESDKEEAKRRARIAEAEAERARKRAEQEKANIYFKDAKAGFSKLDEYVQISSKGKKITINKKGIRQKFALQEAKEISLQIYKDLSEASKLGHPEAESEIYRLQNSPKFTQVAPR
jgi:chromosome segregation ATPase